MLQAAWLEIWLYLEIHVAAGMYSIEDIHLDGKTFSLVISCTAIIATVLRPLGNNQDIEVDSSTPLNEKRADTPLTALDEQDHLDHFALHLSKKRNAIRFGHADNADFRLPSNSKQFRGISRRHFRVFVNEYRSWMLLDTSKNGTVVNEQRILRQQIALHPTQPNVVKIGALHFAIFTVGRTDLDAWETLREWSSPHNADHHDIDTQSSTVTISDAKRSPAITQVPRDNYHVLDSSIPSSCDTSKIRLIIHKSTGRPAVGKFYPNAADEKQASLRMDLLYRVLKVGLPKATFCVWSADLGQSEEFLLPFIEETYLDNVNVIVTEHVQGQTLQALIEADRLPDPLDLLLLHAQIAAGALDWLEKQRIMHRNIRPAAILVKYHQPMDCLLTGFSESCKGPSAEGLVANERFRAPEMQSAGAYTASIDVFSICAVVCHLLGVSQSRELLTDADIAYLLEQGLSKIPASRPRPSFLRSYYQQVIGHHAAPWPPFRSFLLKRYLNLRCAHLDETLIQAEDLQEVLKASIPFSSLPSWINGIVDPVTLRRAAKICHHLNLHMLESTFRDNIRLEDQKAETFTIPYTAESSIYYHAPSLMVNISQALNLAGRPPCVALADVQHYQIVIGEPKWKGIYVDSESFSRIVFRLSSTCRLHFRKPGLLKVDNSVLECRFRNVDSSIYGIFVINRLNPHMILVRRSDRYINLGQLHGEERAWFCPIHCGNFVALDEAVSPSDPGWKKHIQTEMQRSMTDLECLTVEEPDWAESEASFKTLKTTTSFCELETEQAAENSMRFFFKKRRTEKETEVAEKVGQWIAQTPVQSVPQPIGLE